MANFLAVFNDREKALGVWLGIILIAVLLMKDIRPAILQVVKSFFVIWLPVLLMVLYICFVVFLLYKIHLWDTSLIKDTVFWSFGSAFVLFMGLTTAQGATEAKKYFGDIIKEAFKVVAIVEFIVNFYTFGFWIEFFLIPFICVVAACKALADNNTQYESVRGLLNGVLSVVGFIYFGFSIINVFSNYSPLLQISTLVSFVLPLLLTIGFIPFLYCLALFMTYQSFFNRLDIFYREERELAADIKKGTLRWCGLRLILLNYFIGYFDAHRFRIRTSSDLRSFFYAFKRSRTQEIFPGGGLVRH